MSKEKKDEPSILESILTPFRKLLHDILHLRDTTDVEGTINSIDKSIVLEGYNLWILLCAAGIASIGLDTNSPAVIIGAMLISPLMSPILGLGLSIGINSRSMLLKSLWNFAIAVSISLLASFLYFKITPFGSFTAEMQARTEPTLLDVFVAIFGGIAGIVAGSRMDKTNAIPGVAIATALMPPLCTAGYGISVWDFEIFFGAFYLFFINAVFISLTTFLIVRYLKFPLKNEFHISNSRNFTIVSLTGILLLLVPSVWFLGRKLQEQLQYQVLEDFIHAKINKKIDRQKGQWFYEPMDSSEKIFELRIFSFGSKNYIDSDSLTRLQTSINSILREKFNILNITGYDSCVINLIQSESPEERIRAELRTELYTQIERKFQKEFGTYEAKDQKITQAEKELKLLRKEMERIQGDSLQFTPLSKEVKALFPEVASFSFSRAPITDYDTLTSACIVAIRWEKSMERKVKEKREYSIRIENFIKAKLEDTHVYLLEITEP